ncbi:hypothetical protein PENTCL1PPCAC_13830, partial [Pristionchus entomophagus]
ESNIGLLECGRVIRSVSSDGHDLTILGAFGVDDALHQDVLVRGLSTSEHAKLRPDLVQLVLVHLALLVSDSRIELSTLEREEV